MKTSKYNLVKDLTNANGISGFEEEVIEVVEKYATSSCEITVDKMNNAFLNKKENKGNRPVLMIDGHSDEVGFMVQSINAKGLIKFIAIGGWSPANIPAHLVRVRNSDGKYIKGVTTSKPPHFSSAADRSKMPSIDNMFIDIGASTRSEVMDLFKIEIGAPVVPDVDFDIVEETRLMRGKAFDDRIGCACVISVLNELEGEELNIDLIGTISTQEEVGLRGAKVTANTVRPDLAIVFEGTPADDSFRGEFDSQAAIKKGPQVRHRDGCMVTHPRFLAFARKIAKEEGILFQDAVRAGGGTDAGAIHMAHNGIPTIVIGIPTRYIHSHYGYCSIDDYENAIKWGLAIARKLDKATLDLI